jgi:ADP-heptose:LPS heptosyltransferase
VDTVIPYSKDGTNPDMDRIAGSVDFDLVVDLQNSLRSRRTLRAVKSKRTVRFRRQRLLRFFCVYMPWVWKGRLRHTVEAYADTIAPLGVALPDCIPKITVQPGLVDHVGDEFGAGPFIGICPGGSS